MSTDAPSNDNAACYVELQVTTHFSFLRGASSPEDLFKRAGELGLDALGIADRNSMAGIVQAWQAAKDTGLRLVAGCRLDLADGTSLLVYPTDRAAYSRLCRLLSLGKKRAGKGKCHLVWADVEAWNEGLIGILVPDLADDLCAQQLRRMKALFGDRAYMALTLRRRPDDALRLHELAGLAAAAGVPAVATNDVLFDVPEKRILQDVVTCIRHNCTIDALGFRRERHADRHLKAPAEMARLFSRYPEAIARTREIMDRCRFDMSQLEYQYPDERTHPELTPQACLRKFVWMGAKERYADRTRYPRGVPNAVLKQLLAELAIIDELDYAAYFLTVHAIVAFARSQDILCQGRGSAANSSVCYVLGVTAVDPVENDLLFERFISRNRNEPPDIDVDFEHERREEVLQWVYETYGLNHAALCSTVIRYRSKGALRDVGRALGLPEDLITTLSKQIRRWAEDMAPGHLEGLGIDLDNRRIRLALELTRMLRNTPRHLSQHPGGFVLTRDRLDDLVPIEPAAMKDRQVIEWDKDDIDILKFMKMDCLALGMLTCMKKAFDLLKTHKHETVELYEIPKDDEPTYDMICKADTIGVFQIESRAQMTMLPRLKPRKFYDIAIEVAIVRPGPIQGDMVHPYLKRRDDPDLVDIPKGLEHVLGKTLGVPLFQEQAMRVAIDGAGFDRDRADLLRRKMATFKKTGGIHEMAQELIDGMKRNGYSEEFAHRLCKQLEGFGSYGFPESHAISFAYIAYASSWMKCHHPDVFGCALLNSQPMGFYAPAQIVRDAREHGVEVRPVCLNASRWDCTLEPADDPRSTGGRLAIRLGLRLVKGLREDMAARLVVARGLFPDVCPYVSPEDAWRRGGVPVAVLACLAEADAFLPSLGLSRRQALWQLKGLRDRPLPLFDAMNAAERTEPAVDLRTLPAGGEVVKDYGAVGLSLRRHPVGFVRGDLDRLGVKTCAAATAQRDRTQAVVAGMVLVRQQPGTASGVVFMTIEDETGIANIVIWNRLYEAARRTIMASRMIKVTGQIQREGEVVHLVAHALEDLTPLLNSIGLREEPFAVPSPRGDDFRHGEPGPDPRMLKKQREVINMASRDFH
jgi:error-prone DNA polymerase